MFSDITREGGAAAAAPVCRTTANRIIALQLCLNTDIESPLRTQKANRILITLVEQIIAPGEKGEHIRRPPARRQVEGNITVGLEAGHREITAAVDPGPDIEQ